MAESSHRNGWSYIGEGIAWFLILTGMGSCMYLSTSHDKPLIVIEKPISK
jgi:hypothetical protein